MHRANTLNAPRDWSVTDLTTCGVTAGAMHGVAADAARAVRLMDSVTHASRAVYARRGVGAAATFATQFAAPEAKHTSSTTKMYVNVVSMATQVERYLPFGRAAMCQRSQ